MICRRDAASPPTRNGAWGYLRFDALNLYYVHGRWYNPDTGLFLSPDANGAYRYGSGQDAVNYAWRAPAQLCSARLQAELSDCEKFVDEVRRLISIAQTQGGGDDWAVMLLAEYYSGIPTAWQIGGIMLPNIGGGFFPGITPQVIPFPQIQDRWREPQKVHDLNSTEGQEARRRYGFKRIFYTNTHHYFAEFYSAWFWGTFIAKAFSTEREKRQTWFEGQSYFEGAADIAVADIARRHVEHIRKTQWTVILGAGGPGGIGLLPVKLSNRNALAILPQLLAHDACARSEQEIFASWPPPEIDKILGPAR